MKLPGCFTFLPDGVQLLHAQELNFMVMLSCHNYDKQHIWLLFQSGLVFVSRLLMLCRFYLL